MARSIDISGLLAAASKALIASADIAGLAEVQQRWARAIASSIDLSALHSANEALVSSAAFGAVSEAPAS